MKEQWSISKDKLVSIEDGLICNEETARIRPTVQTDTCKKLIQCIKFILYLELLLFVGWGCYAIWQTYRVESIEVKVTDSIQESEQRNLHDQRSHLEESTITPNEILTQMENLLQAENALSKTVDVLQKQLDEDRLNKDPNSRLQNSRESDVEVKSSPLPEANVPEMIVVDLGKDVAEDEPKRGFDLSKSEETVLEWSFGLLLFPGAYNIKDRSQIAENDGSEQSKTTESLSENDKEMLRNDEEMIDSAEADRIIEEIAKVLRDAKPAELREDVATTYQRFSPGDLSKMGVPLPVNVMLTPPAVFVDPSAEKDQGIIDPIDDGSKLVPVIVNHSEPIPEFQDDIVHDNPTGEYGDSQFDESAILDTTVDDVERSFLVPTDWALFDDAFDSSVGTEAPDTYGDSGIVNKRSIPDAPLKEQHLWNKRVEDNLNQPKEEVIYNRDHP